MFVGVCACSLRRLCVCVCEVCGRLCVSVFCAFVCLCDGVV